jgi:hypothetical protein
MKYGTGITLNPSLVVDARLLAKRAVAEFAAENNLTNTESAALIYEVVRVGKRQAEATVWQQPFRA